MEETLKMMKQFIVGYERKLSIEELLKEYQENMSPNILAYLFISNYGVIYNVSKNYLLLTGDDKASLCLQQLDKCIYKYNSNMKCSFITYFLVCYKNLLRTETEQLFSHKRYANYITDDISDYQEMLSTDSDNINILDLDNYNLTQSQMQHCKLIVNGYSNKEISKILKVSVQYIYKLNEILGKKLSDLV